MKKAFFILIFFCSSAYGADYYYLTWQEALIGSMDRGFIGFNGDSNPNVCWLEIWDKKNNTFYYPNPNAVREYTASCMTEYASKGIVPLPVGMSEEEVTEVMFGFCGIVAALCFLMPIIRSL